MLTKLTFAAAALIFTTVGFSQELPKTKDAYKRKEFNLPSMDQPIVIKDSPLIRNQQVRELRNQKLREVRNQQLREAFLRQILAQHAGQYNLMILPPDNMPCLMPDKNQVVRMPNANPPGVPPAPMPNAGAVKRKPVPSNK